MERAFVILSVFFLLLGCTGSRAEAKQKDASVQQASVPSAIGKTAESNVKFLLGENECFYNSKTKELSCGRNFSVVHKGIEYNVSPKSVNVDICGLTGFVGEKQNKSDANDTSDTYLVFIIRGEDQRFNLSENLSQHAVGSVMFDEECG